MHVQYRIHWGFMQWLRAELLRLPNVHLLPRVDDLQWRWNLLGRWHLYVQRGLHGKLLPILERDDVHGSWDCPVKWHVRVQYRVWWGVVQHLRSELFQLPDVHLLPRIDDLWGGGNVFYHRRLRLQYRLRGQLLSVFQRVHLQQPRNRTGRRLLRV